MTTTPAPRVAIVTGAARGIGAGVAKRLAADGLAVAALDLDEAACKPVVEAIEAAGPDPLPLKCWTRPGPSSSAMPSAAPSTLRPPSAS
ncbi:short subunit dehydrogenase [Streptomyces sp. TLI_235]|nr:short subunit dehydrogenase [Streptomyces sp. TLI_235]